MEFGIAVDHLGKVVFVSDQGPNIKDVLKNFKGIPCLAHVLNTVLRHTFDERDATVMEEVMEQIDLCKQLVTYF